MYRIMDLTDVTWITLCLLYETCIRGSTITVSQIIIVTNTVAERLQIHLCTLIACNVYSCQMPAHSHYDNAFSITVLAL